MFRVIAKSPLLTVIIPEYRVSYGSPLRELEWVWRIGQEECKNRDWMMSESHFLVSPSNVRNVVVGGTALTVPFVYVQMLLT